MRRTCWLACKVVMNSSPEQNARHKLITLAEKQNFQPHLHLDPPHSSQQFFGGRSGWTLIKRRCCIQSVAHEDESMDFGDLEATHLAKCKRQTLECVHNMSALIHLTDCARDSVLAASSIPVFPVTRVASSRTAICKVEDSSLSTGSTAESPGMLFDVLDKGTVRAFDVPSLGLDLKATAAVMDKHAQHVDDYRPDFSTMSAQAYLAESWSEDLEQAIVDASDACMDNMRMKHVAMQDPKVKAMIDEVAIADMTVKIFVVEQCKDEVVDDLPSNIHSDDIESSQTSSSKVAFNCEEAFVTPKDCISTEERIGLSDDEWSPPDTPLKFSKQQMEVLEAVACGKSVFITGSAGTGKSFLLKYIIRILKKAHDGKHVHVTASTGLAACALNGITLHSFAGIGLGYGTPMSLAARVLGTKDSRNRWRDAAVLIVDEISMIDGELFEKLEYVARRVRNSTRCFGGIQLIVTGDFFQLPPVNPPNLRKYFAFEAECWNSCFDMQVELEHVFRQSDSVFVNMLNEIRKGLHTPETLQKLSMCCRDLPEDETGIVPTRLYPLKVDVRQENLQELRALQTSIVTFSAVDFAPNPLHRYMFSSMRAEKKLQLCVGAQVMLIKNIDTQGGLVNGTKGVVTGFQMKHHHRSGIQNDENSKKLNSMSHLVSPSGYWPIVRFHDGVIKTLGPEAEVLEDGGVDVASRIQVPLILAWALSVHKCQGMTLSKVQTDLSKAFDYGMVYVALSRVKDLDGLQLIGFDPTRIRVHPNVITFSKKLIREESLKQENIG